MKEIEIRISPAEAHNTQAIREALALKLGILETELQDFKILRRSIDARGRDAVFQLRIAVFIKNTLADGSMVTEGGTFQPEPSISKNFKDVSSGKPVIIIGAGPAGYFAALELIELGLKPIIFDRGKDVQARRRDLRAIQQLGIVNPHSNYCFGEGGAGTYSDGKLYTRSHKRGSIEKSLKLFVEHGATTDILIDAHPHIGSNKLPQVVQNLRETILYYGGEVHFESFVTDFILSRPVGMTVGASRESKIIGVVVNEKDEHFAEATILATGHSARDIYELCLKKGIFMEAKPFALGVRIEHSQELVDMVQYKTPKRSEFLPAASYSLVTQAEGRGVFSFCMCPGGLVVPAATAPGEIVVNGMSMSRRDSAYANSGTVVAIELEDLKGFENQGVLAALAFQKSVEQKLFAAGDGSQKAPAQRLTDFVNRKTSKDLRDTSYIPGLFSAPLHELLPPSVYGRLRAGVLEFGKMMKGYMTENANVIGTESRTSAPVRIPRHSETLMHEDLEGFFPCGEGAGYAGGIISAAMDGQNVAKAVSRFYQV
jgi:uncharacterized protein